MAGLGYKDFTAGAVLTAAQVDGYLMEQSVMNFAGTAARGSALSSVQSAGMMAHVGGGTVTVYDGSAWQQVYPAQAGLVFVAGTAFSAVGSVSVNNCFTSTYANYLLIASFTTSTGSDIFYRNRLSGSDSIVTYYWQSFEANNTSLSGQRTSNTSAYIANYSPGSTGSWILLHVLNPNAASPTKFISNGGRDDTTPVINVFSGSHNVSTAYDGFTFYPATGTLSGTVRVYGYRNS